MIVWLASYPRSGNTFFRVILSQVYGAKSSSIYNDPFDIAADPRMAELVGHEALQASTDFAALRDAGGVVFLRTHAPRCDDVDDRDRVVYLIRDGREAVVSQFHYLRDFRRAAASLLDLVDGRSAFGSWAGHVRAWSACASRNGWVIRFEDLMKDPLAQVRPVAEAIGLQPRGGTLPTFEELRALDPKFFRSGRTDSWTAELDDVLHLLFWLRSRDVMLKHGYAAGMPDLLKREGADALCAAVECLQRNSWEYSRDLMRQLAQIGKQTAELAREMALRRRAEEQLRQKLAGSETDLRARTAELERRTTELQDLRARLRRLEDLLGRFVAMSTWTQPMRKMRALRRLCEYDGRRPDDNVEAGPPASPSDAGAG